MSRRPRPAHRVQKESFSEEFKEGYEEENESVMRNTLKRRREGENEDEDEDEEVDAETDIEVDADAPRVAQWLDDEDDTLPGRSWEDESKQKVPDEVWLFISPHNNMLKTFELQESQETGAYLNSLLEGKGKAKVGWSIKPRKDIPKRINKNV